MFHFACLTFELANKTLQNNGDPVQTAKLNAHTESGEFEKISQKNSIPQHGLIWWVGPLAPKGV